MDIGPTILDLAGCGTFHEAVSMRPALQGDESWKGRDYLFCEQVGDMVLTDAKFMTMIPRDKKWHTFPWLEWRAIIQPRGRSYGNEEFVEFFWIPKTKRQSSFANPELESCKSAETFWLLDLPKLRPKFKTTALIISDPSKVKSPPSTFLGILKIWAGTDPSRFYCGIRRTYCDNSHWCWSSLWFPLADYYRMLH